MHVHFGGYPGCHGQAYGFRHCHRPPVVCHTPGIVVAGRVPYPTAVIVDDAPVRYSRRPCKPGELLIGTGIIVAILGVAFVAIGVTSRLHIFTGLGALGMASGAVFFGFGVHEYRTHKAKPASTPAATPPSPPAASGAPVINATV